MQKHLRIFAASALLASSSVALAVPFNSFDPRSMGMGGAGVAVGDAGTAPFFNPALLTVTRAGDNFSLNLPVVGARVYAPSEYRDFKDGDYINKLDQSIQAYNSAQTSTNITAVANDTSALSAQLAALSDKPVQAEGGAGMVIGIPGKSFGGAFFVSGSAALGGEIKYRDGQNLQDFITAANAVANTISTSCGGTVNTSNPTCVAGLTALSTNPAINGYFTVTPSGVTSTFDTGNNLKSTVDVRGVVLGEMGFALSRQYGEGAGAWALGITPKMVRVKLYDYSVNVDSNANSTPDGSDYTAEYSHFNFDLGLAKNYNNGWRAGFVVKNVIPHTYDFKRIPSGAPSGSAQIVTGEINLKPQARLGVSHATNWSTVAMDLDLTANNPAGMENKSQYLALGTELNAWDWMQVRLGYRANLKDSKRNIPSVGLGLAPFGTLHVDVAVSKSSNEIGASARLALTF
jgi:hypothetical protein